MNKSQIIVAVDVPTHVAALELARSLDPNLCRLKVGMELFTAAGPAVVEDLRELGFEIFLDLKFHDIPNTVAGALRSAANLGVWMVNVHCFGGRSMLESAVNALANVQNRPILIGVTVLTSMNDPQLSEIGLYQSPGSHIDYRVTGFNYQAQRIAKQLAVLAMDSGLDGVVCSGQEAAMIRSKTNESFVLVTPGIRLPDGNQDDQARIVTPEIAIQSGASYLVVGRPITGAADPIVALHDFNQRIALSNKYDVK